MTQPLDLDQIEARAAEHLAALSGWLNCYSPLPEQEALEGAEGVLKEDVPAMAAEIRRLRAELAAAREQAITDVGNWLSEHGQKNAAYLVRTVDIPATDTSGGPDRCSGCRYVPCSNCAAVSAARP